MKYTKFIVFSLLFVLLGACNKYEEGSNFSLLSAKNRLVNNWKLTKYEVGGVNQPINNNTGLEMDFYNDNTFKRTWVIGGWQVPENGDWAFVDGKRKITLKKSDGTLELYTIVQLKSKDFKAKRVDEGVEYVYTFEGK
jgi:hypothetical protein